MKRFLYATLFLVIARTSEESHAQQKTAKLDFEQLVVTIEPFGLSQHSQREVLQIRPDGRCFYKVDARKAQKNIVARNAATIRHQFSASRIRQFNELLKKTKWLTAEGAEGRATHTHPTKITITLKRDGQERTVVCNGRRPQPYGALLHAIHSVAVQERRVYLHDYVSGKDGEAAWQEIGREIAALRGDPYGKSPYSIDHKRYVPIAQRIMRRFYGKNDAELIATIRLIGHYRLKDELKFLHRLAHDRGSNNLRSEVAWALGRIRNDDSLPVLASMMSAPANREAAGKQLVYWGKDAGPHIVKLIKMSTDATLDSRENVVGEDMIRAYLAHWEKIRNTIDPRVIAAVRKAYDDRDPANGRIRVTYHKEFLNKVGSTSEN